jgi:hypothetical protein
MQKVGSLVFGVFLLLNWSAVCLAQTTRIAVAVDYTGDVAVGRLGLALNEAIAGSRLFRLVDTEYPPSSPRITVRLASVESTVTGKLVGHAFAIVYVYDSLVLPLPGIISQQSMVCPPDGSEACAKPLLTGIDHAVDWLRNNKPHLWKQLTAGSAK